MTTEAIESVDDFRARARAWIPEHLDQRAAGSMHGLLRGHGNDEEELAAVEHDRQLQRRLFDAGFAGICVPTEYGGQGLTPEHQKAFNEELSGYEYPTRFQSPTMSPCMAVLLDFGTEEQKKTHVPAILRGEELWMQFLSEPSSGSDVAGALTTAVRDGDEWLLNGSKVWTTGAWWSDWGLCLTRTNWDVPKHRGLSVFIFPIHQSGIEVHRIEMLNGSKEFCQEFMTDVRVPDTDRVGEVDDGWTVGTRWMFHERMLHNSPFVTMPASESHRGVGASAVRSIALAGGHLDDPRVRDLVGEAHTLQVVTEALTARLSEGLRTRTMSDQAAAIGRLFGGVVSTRTTSIMFELSGADGGTWAAGDGPIAESGNDYLLRQVATIGGGTTEMARNVISERVLGMPRERTLDKDVPFRDVPRSPS
jgi:alkylation response protein AidB-like acyl-CoA dehydrogenase